MTKKPTYEELAERVRELEKSESKSSRMIEAFQKKEILYGQLFENMLHEVHIWKLVFDEYDKIRTWELVDANPAALKSWGKSLPEIVGRTTDEIFPNSNATELFMPIVKNIFKDNTPHIWESYFPDTDQFLHMVSIPIGEYFISTGLDVTERKRVEEELRVSEQKFRNLAENVPGLVLKYKLNPDGSDDLLYISKSVEDIFEVSQEDAFKDNKLLWNRVHKDDLEKYIESVKMSAESLSLWELEHRLLFPGGKVKWIYTRGVPFQQDDGSVVWDTMAMDITEQKSAENALRINETKYRQLFESNIDGIIRTDLDGGIKEVNPAFLKMVGYENIDDLKRTYQELTPEKWHSFEADIVKNQIFKRGYSDEYEKEYIHKDGTVFPISVKVWLVKDKDKSTGMWGIVRDISERRKAEELILKNQYYLTKAQEIGKIGTWELDIQKNRLIWTDENYKIFGVPLGKEITYELFLSYVHPDDRDYVHRKWRAALNNQPYDIMHRLIVNDKVKWVREKADIEFDADGHPVMAIGFTQDLTDFKQIEDALKESERRFKTMFEQAPLSYQSLDENGNFTEVNQTWLQTMGYERDEVIGKNFSEFLVPDWKSHFADNFPRFKAVGEVLGVEFEMVKKDGSTILVSFHGKIGKNPDGSFKQTHCIFNDITRQRQFEEEKEVLEQKMLQMQKLESIGNLAGGIAHDFNNLLFPIIGMSEMLLEDLPKNSPEHENAQEIFNAGRRAGDLVNQILAFSRQSEHKMIPVHVQNVLKEVLRLSRSTIPTNIEIKQNIQQDCGLIMADTTQIHQVTMNLITNAYHAVEDENGVIKIDLKEIVLNENELLDKELLPGKYVKLSVSDNGIGMAQSTISKIFEPYFTTKEKGKGTGLGLAVVYGIVKEHKGDITVYSELGKGTTFGIYLPLMKKNKEAVSTEKATELETGKERILLVDDEISVAKLEGQMLSRLGYEVTVKTNSEDALSTFKSDSESFDIVISDMTMPNMTGDKLAQKILAVRPEIPIIICTGFSERINKEQAEILNVKGLLMKPIVKSDMAQMIRKVLDESQNS